MEQNTINGFKVFPNPSSGLFQVTLEDQDQIDYEIIVFNTIGEEIYKGKNVKTIDLSNQTNGIYLISVLIENKARVTQRLFKN